MVFNIHNFHARCFVQNEMSTERSKPQFAWHVVFMVS